MRPDNKLQCICVEDQPLVVKGRLSSGLTPRDRSSNTIGLRAEMDALPIVEETQTSWVSTAKGVNHACANGVIGTIFPLAGLRFFQRITKQQTFQALKNAACQRSE